MVRGSDVRECRWASESGVSEYLSRQSETRYNAVGTGISGDFVKQTTPDAVTHTHMDSSMRIYPQFKVTKHAGSNNNVFLEDASMLPSAGTLHSRQG